MNTRTRIFVFLLVLSMGVRSQNLKKIDSIQNVLKKDLHDTTRIILLGLIVDEYFPQDLLRSEEIQSKILSIAEKGYASAEGPVKKFYAMSIYTSLNNIGYLHKKMGDVKTATDLYFRSLQVAEKENYLPGVSTSAFNIGALYKTMDNHDKAFEYYKIALDASKRAGYEAGEAQAYKSIGGYYKYKNDTAKALEYMNKAVEMYKRSDKNSDLSTCYNNIADLFIKTKNSQRALQYLQLALSINDSVKDKESRSIIYNNFARVYISLKKPDIAINNLKKAEILQAKVKFPEIYLTTQQCFYMAFLQKKEYKDALDRYQQYRKYSDSLNSKRNREELLSADMRHEFEKKELELRKEQDKKDALAFSEARKQKVITFSVCGVLIIVLIFSIFIYRNYKEKQKINIELADKNEEIHKQKELVEEKQKEIVDSINYARQIQKTLLANHELVNQTIPDSFVMFQPKDIVSGDFYWATRKGNLFYLAVCDSTGHGVPGAFMSLLNISFLNEALKEKGLEKPNEIFDFVRDRLIANISQAGRKDGMDGILICIDNNGKITYAAANNGPLTISDGIVKEFPADKMPVGKGEKEDPFTLYELPIRKGDMLYLYTDGYADQFGGPKGKKFKYKQLDDLLLTNFKLPVIEQENRLIAKFEEWKGKLEQVDDVCILGIRI
jgi:serine phosphatase RsbU (regulator of sigma subunit)